MIKERRRRKKKVKKETKQKRDNQYKNGIRLWKWKSTGVEEET